MAKLDICQEVEPLCPSPTKGTALLSPCLKPGVLRAGLIKTREKKRPSRQSKIIPSIVEYNLCWGGCQAVLKAIHKLEYMSKYWGNKWVFHTLGEKISLIAEEDFFSRSGKGERLSDKLILVIGLKVRTQTLG
jgi:hypothetical protein